MESLVAQGWNFRGKGEAWKENHPVCLARLSPGFPGAYSALSRQQTLFQPFLPSVVSFIPDYRNISIWSYTLGVDRDVVGAACVTGLGDKNGCFLQISLLCSILSEIQLQLAIQNKDPESLVRWPSR